MLIENCAIRRNRYIDRKTERKKKERQKERKIERKDRLTLCAKTIYIKIVINKQG